MDCVCVWLVFAALEEAAAEPGAKMLYARLQYLGAAFVSTFWLGFCFTYTRQMNTRPRWFLPLLTVPAATVLMVFTNDYHHLFWPTISPSPYNPNVLIYAHGPAFWGHTVLSYGYLLLGAYLLVRAAVHKPRLKQFQSGALITGMFLPLLGNVIYVAGLSPVKGFDPTPYAFILSGLIYSLTLSRLYLFEIVPKARSILETNLPDGVVILERGGKVASINPVARTMVGIGKNEEGMDWEKLVKGCPPLAGVELTRQSESHQFISSGGKEPKLVEVRVIPVMDARGRTDGTIVMLRDVTEQERSRHKLVAARREEKHLRETLEIRLRQLPESGRMKPQPPMLHPTLTAQDYQFNRINGNAVARQPSGRLQTTASQPGDLPDEAPRHASRQAENPQPENATLNIAVLLHQTMQHFRPAIASRMILLESKVPDGLPLVCGESSRLAGVLNRLMLAALEYTPAGGRVTIQARPGPGNVEVRVENRVDGISDEAYARALDAYRCCDGVKAPLDEPTGGQSPCPPGIVEGIVRVESTPGNRILASFILPLA
jgi:PAS domain-containing protein